MNIRSFWCIVGLSAGILITLIAGQVADFVSASRTTAEVEASIRFDLESRNRNINKIDFSGPQLESQNYRSYHFKWLNKNNGDAIFVSVFYLPFDIESWYIPQAEKSSGKSLFPVAGDR